MTDFSKAYDSLTDESNNFITTQLNQKSIWNAIPGSLNKVSTSSLGFAWGIDSSKVYYCQLPCSGQWNNVPINELPLGIARYESNIYILTLNNLFIKLEKYLLVLLKFSLHHHIFGYKILLVKKQDYLNLELHLIGH